MKKIGIITLFDYLNIGNKLQNYAMQELIRGLGGRPITIVNGDLLFKANLKTRIKEYIGFYSAKYKRYYLEKKRRKAFYLDTKDIIACTKPIRMQDIGSLDQDFDAFVVGSDQVWFRWSDVPLEMDFHFLCFTSKNKRICYAPSFGRDSISSDEIKSYEKWLSGFERLSVREQSGVSIVYGITGKEPELLCDPTMILPRERWDNVMIKPRYSVPEKYVLVYFLSQMSEAQRTIIGQYVRNNGCKVINIYCPDSPMYYCTSPREFLYLVRNANYIFTDSFHGTVFSILYHKRFTLFSRNDNGKRMNNRCVTLLDRFGLLDCFDKIALQEQNWEKVDVVIKKERTKGISFLKDELERVINR